MSGHGRRGINVGSLDHGAVAMIMPSGAIAFARGGRIVDWWVIAENRVHHPAEEPAVRQRRLESMPVVETSLRVPGGDVTATAYVAAGVDGVVVELANTSPAAVAVAFDGVVHSDRPLLAAPAGAGVPASARVVPLGHRATTRVVITGDGSACGAPAPSEIASAAQVARGWLLHVAAAPRLVLPSEEWTAAYRAARADLALARVPARRDDPVGYLLMADHRSATGEPAADIATAVELVARDVRRSRMLAWDADAALAIAGRLFAARRERRAAADVAAARTRLGVPGALPTWAERPDRPERVVAWTLAQLASERSATSAAILPAFESSWLGRDIEAHELRVAGGTLNFAVRWHGERPALLWESEDIGELTCPALDVSWRTDQRRGETLLGVPPCAPARS